MRKTMRRVVVTLGAVAVMVGMTMGPAAAATTNVTVSWDAVNGSTLSVAPSSATVTAGDAITFDYSSADLNSTLQVFSSADCSGAPVVSSDGGLTAPLAIPASTTLSMSATHLPNVSACSTFVVTANAVPPPDVPEAPYTIALLGAAAALFGGGFFVLRRRRARVA